MKTKSTDEAIEDLAAIIGMSYFFCMPLAMIISWSENKSILWAIFHAFFSVFYIGYFAIYRWLDL